MQINDKLLQKNIYLKEIKDVTPKTRKKIKIYIGVDMKNFYYLLVELNTKSRFLIKNAKELIEFVSTISEINFKNNKKILFLESPICSKAKEYLKNNGWRIV